MITKDNIESLIKFGGLVVYRVTYFDDILWKDEIICNTFNEDYAKEMYNTGVKNGRIVKFETQIVTFNYKKLV